MAVHSFEWKSGPSDAPAVLSFADDVPIYEDESETHKKGMPLAIDTTKSTAASGVVLIANPADYSDIPWFIAATDGLNASADVDLTQPGVNKASLPYINRPGDIWSVTRSEAGANAATVVTDLGKSVGWIKSTESGETAKAVLNMSDTTFPSWTVVGFDDRDAIGTSGGRLLVMFTPFLGYLSATTGLYTIPQDA